MRVEDIPSYGKDLFACIQEMPLRTKIKLGLNSLVLYAELFSALGWSGYRTMQHRTEEEYKQALKLDWTHIIEAGASQDILEMIVRGMVETKVRADLLGLKHYEKMRRRLSHRSAYDVIILYFAPVDVFQECGNGDFLKPFTQHCKAMFEANEAIGIDKAEFVEETQDTMQFNVTYCMVYEVAKALGNPYLCYISGCYGDEVFFPKYCAEAGFKFEREGTMALGASSCDTRFVRVNATDL